MTSSSDTAPSSRAAEPRGAAPLFRFAQREDVPLILRFIRELADYEHMLDEVVADESTLEEWIFDKGCAEVLFVIDPDAESVGGVGQHSVGDEVSDSPAAPAGREVGFALFFHNFSTFLGRAGIYLEDLYVELSSRGKGLGKAMLTELGRIAVERGCGRLEWWCLDWNKPSIDFYRSLGAEPMSDWTVYRIAGQTLTELAEG